MEMPSQVRPGIWLDMCSEIASENERLFQQWKMGQQARYVLALCFFVEDGGPNDHPLLKFYLMHPTGIAFQQIKFRFIRIVFVKDIIRLLYAIQVRFPSKGAIL